MSLYDDLRCEQARLESDEEEIIVEPCEICGSISWDYLLKNKDGDFVGCDDCITRVYVEER